MFAIKLQANSEVVCNCFIVLNMLSVFTFDIFHTTWGIIDYSWKLLTSYIKSYNFMLNSNIAHLQKWANQSILESALVIGLVNRFFSESKKKFGCLRKSERSNGKKLRCGQWDIYFH